MTTTKLNADTIATDDIRAIRAEAELDHDRLKVELCDVALNGDTDGLGTLFGTPCSQISARQALADSVNGGFINLERARLVARRQFCMYVMPAGAGQHQCGYLTKCGEDISPWRSDARTFDSIDEVNEAIELRGWEINTSVRTGVTTAYAAAY